MKMPLEWHRQNLRYRDEHNEKERANLLDRLNALSRHIGEANVLRSQIGQAAKEGRDGFDEVTFLVKRKTK